MTTIAVQLPESLHKRIKYVVQQEGISAEQFVITAVTEKLASIDTAEYLKKRAERGSREKLLAVLAKAPDVEPEEADRL